MPLISRPCPLLLICLAFVGLAGTRADAQQDSHKNVLLICVDDLKPTLGCYDDPIAITPGIDALAARGVQFNSAYCNQAVCAPSRNSLMTGLTPQRIGVYDLGTYFRKAAPHAVTIGQHLIANGYQSHSIGKIFHRGHGNVIDPESFSGPPWTPKASTYATDQSSAQTIKTPDGRKRGPSTERAEVDDDRFADGQIAMEAIKRLEEYSNNPEKPFFMGVGFVRPHLPFVAPAKYWDQYDPAELPMPKIDQAPDGAPSYAATNFGELLAYSDFQNTKKVDQKKTRHLIHGYYAATSYMDAQVDRVVKAVDRLGLSDNTIIVLWGDHGWHLGDHGMWCKHTNYEQANRIPLIVVAPGAKQNLKSEAMVETVDLFPTICELAAVETPNALDGKSFEKVARGQSKTIRDHVIHVYPRGGRLGHAVRDRRYRLVRWADMTGKSKQVDFELYDYRDDPLETRNLVDQLPEVAKRLTEILDEQPRPKLDYRIAQKAISKSKSRRKADPKKKPYDRAAGFKRRDQNGDGFLTFEEFVSTQPDPEKAKDRFPIFDKDGDKKLSADEFIRPGKLA